MFVSDPMLNFDLSNEFSFVWCRPMNSISWLQLHSAYLLLGFVALTIIYYIQKIYYYLGMNLFTLLCTNFQLPENFISKYLKKKKKVSFFISFVISCSEGLFGLAFKIDLLVDFVPVELLQVAFLTKQEKSWSFGCQL